MRQFAKFFGNSKLSVILSTIIFAILFGFMHSYLGIIGQIITSIIGLLRAIIFHLKKYDLWSNIAVHGLFDTIPLLAIYHGWV
ncbi:type II CAAX prenyl endopeptidase Rce1 family protein [Patiriisocius sp. Uisw_017]|uniref:CPBP family glutamic-type intramembrane protease n=1 Tax=Patiriisocius sp. Uisw_017 TaxID=3230968 RepID=UPI0039EB7182